MEKHLIIKGCAGLGNRLYTLSNAINYAKKTERTIIVDWKDGQFSKKGVNSFDLFFELKNIRHINDLNKITDLDRKSCFPLIWKNILDTNLYDNFEQDSLKLPLKVLSRFSSIYSRFSMTYGYFRHKKNAKKTHWENFTSQENFIQGQYLPLNMPQDIVVFVDFSPKYYENIIRESIVLKPNIRKKIETFVLDNKLKTDSIAVHIRYTDKKPDASFDLLYKRIEELKPKNKTIFLSTDNLEIQKMFKQKYTKVVNTIKYLPPEQKEGLHQWALYNNEEESKSQMFEDSILDMWILSKCEHLIYQKNSSFSQVSRILKNNKNCYPW